MADLTAIMVQIRAQRAAWAGQSRLLRERLKKSRHVLVSAALVACGLAGAAAGGYLVGRWCLGLVLIAESGGAVWFGLMRDDGTALPRRGGRTIADVAEEYRRLPQLGEEWPAGLEPAISDLRPFGRYRPTRTHGACFQSGPDHPSSQGNNHWEDVSCA